MRYPSTTDENGQPTLVEEDKHGTNKHGFTDGTPLLYVSSLGVNGDATEIHARVMDDLVTNVKEACIEANGDGGPAAGDAVDDPFELARAVNTAANVLTGEASFVASGLRFTTSGANFTVELSAGVIVYGGRKYHVTLTKLSAIEVEVDGSPAGTGMEFDLIASRDFYVSIGPLADDDPLVLDDIGSRFTITVTDVANGAAAPAVPAGEFVFAMLATDGSGVTDVVYYGDGPRLQSGDGSELVLRPSPDGPGVGHVPASLHKSATGIMMDIGYDVADSDEGRFDTAYLRGLNVRTNAVATQTYSENIRYTDNTSIAGGGSANVAILDSSGYPTGTAAYVEIKGAMIDPSDDNDGYTFRIECHVHKTGGTWTLEGSGSSPAFQDGNTAIAAGVALSFNVNAGILRLGITGHGTDATRWFMEVHYVLLGD